MLGKCCQSSHIPSGVFCWGGLCYPCQPGSSGGLRGPAGLGTAPSQRPQAVVLLWACQLCHFLSGIRLGGDSGSPEPVTRPQPKEASARKISVLSAYPSGTDKNTRRGPRPALWPRKQTLAGWLTSSFTTTLRLLFKPYCPLLPGGCWGGASWMPTHPTPPRPLASFESEPEVTAPLADPRLRYRNLAQTDSAQPQSHRAGRGNCDIRQREGTGGSGWQRNLPSAKRFCPQTAMVMGTACSCRAPGPQAFP